MSAGRTAILLTAVVAVGVALPASAAQVSPKVRAPKSGKYTGRPGKMEMYISGRSIELLSFSFKCRGTSGRTNLNGIPLKRTRRGYRFAIKSGASVTYADGKPDQNGSVAISGRFSRTGRSAAGVLKVRTSRCGSTGTIDWRAHR